MPESRRGAPIATVAEPLAWARVGAFSTQPPFRFIVHAYGLVRSLAGQLESRVPELRRLRSDAGKNAHRVDPFVRSADY